MPSSQPLSLHGVRHTAPDFDVPALACDCHTHVFGPDERYPFDPARKYTPPSASIEELRALHDYLGIGRVVIVHPSPYGSDNSATLDALRELGERSRGVAVIDEQTSDAALQQMHALGVRGIRLNLQTAGIADPGYADRQLKWAAERVGPLGWHVQMFTNLKVISALQATIAGLGVPVVIDHFGCAKGRLGANQPELDSLLEVVRAGAAWVKLSAPYRISDDPDSASVRELAQALIAANADRMVWGSDWPHPGGGDRKLPLDEIEPFQPIDDGRALNRLAEWAPDRVILEKILVENPALLYDF